jgi:hypothetical protein
MSHRGWRALFLPPFFLRPLCFCVCAKLQETMLVQGHVVSSIDDAIDVKSHGVLTYTRGHDEEAIRCGVGKQLLFQYFAHTLEFPSRAARTHTMDQPGSFSTCRRLQESDAHQVHLSTPSNDEENL